MKPHNCMARRSYRLDFNFELEALLFYVRSDITNTCTVNDTL
jgi:hypothetical protein